MYTKTKKLRWVFVIYWCMLAYIIAALVWWFIALSQQNKELVSLRISELNTSDIRYDNKYKEIIAEENIKEAQYAGEGIFFLLLIVAAAIFIFRAVRRQLKLSQLQQNFMIAITHELKTPIAVAKLNLETVQKRKLDESMREKLLQNTLEEINRLNSLSNNILLSSQMEAGGYQVMNEKLNLREVLLKCIDEFTIRFPTKKISLDADSDLFVNGDKFLLEMVINNLIDNAVKYSPRLSEVFVKLAMQENEIRFSIADEGQGIPDSEKDNIFGKYYRIGNEATRSAKGTGLGLYLAYKLIRAHNGTIDVRDNKPAGTIFTVTLKKVNPE